MAGCVWGDYHQYVERWYDSLVEAATTEIVLVTDKPRPDIPCKQILNPPHGEYREASWWTAGVEWLSTEYRGTLGVDDTVVPDVWDGLQGDVYLLGMRVVGPSNHTLMPPYDTAQDYLRHKAMIVCHASPYKAEWFTGYPQIAYSDWKIYLDMARAGAEFYNPKKIGVTHYDHPDSLSHGFAKDHHKHRSAAIDT